MHLASQETRELSLTVMPFVGTEAPSDADVAAREAMLERWRSAFTSIAIPGHRLFESILEANIGDIASFPLLDGARDEWLAMQAGMPAYTLVVDPVLPTWMPEVVLRGLRVGGATASLRFWREESGVSRWEVLHKSGTLRIVRQPTPESLTAGFAARLTGLLQTAV